MDHYPGRSTDDIVGGPAIQLSNLSHSGRYRYVAIFLLLTANASKLWAAELDHWAYRSVVRPSLPVVSARDWPRNAIDYFVLHDLEKSQKTPLAPLSKPVWLRRITFDLTGVPPTLAELDAFLEDQSPDAMVVVVDRLLASPRFGERMTAQWLDLARYADTHGYHADAHRDMWRWRDWVIEAFNTNMPFDQFTIEQLAGDLLPNATLRQRIATGFNRNTMVNFEDGAIAEEYLTEYVADRVVTTSTVWLGQTMQCARCHDHKYDPFTQEDFFRLFAFFHNVAENGLDGEHGNAAPFIKAPTRLQQQALTKLSAKIEHLEGEFARRSLKVDHDMATWEAELRRGKNQIAGPPETAVAYFPFDKLADGKTEEEVSGNSSSVQGDVFLVPGKFGSAALFGGDSFVEIEHSSTRKLTKDMCLALWIFPSATDHMVVMSSQADDSNWTLSLDEGRLSIHLYEGDSRKENSIHLRADNSLKMRRWQHVTLVFKEANGAARIRILVDGSKVPLQAIKDQKQMSARFAPPTRIGSGPAGDHTDGFRGLLDDVRIYQRAMTEQELERLADGTPIGRIVTLPAGKRTVAERAQLRSYYLQHVDSVSRELLQSIKSLRRQYHKLDSSVPTTMVMSELAQPRKTYVLERGNYQHKSTPVTADTPAVLPPMRLGWPKNRLGLAHWLVDDCNPLTARVAVNRYWQLLFVDGLLATPEDFGTRGQPPTNPELMDWLAAEFVASGWNVKQIIRLIATSSAYRQSLPRQSLAAEMVRDSALLAAGLLDRRIGGRSVFPYQPSGLWRAVAYDPNELTAQVYRQSHGADLYRRGMYTFWKRAVPPPSLEAFGAPNREYCVVRRAQPNTPLQALVLMNDPTYVEASRVLAETVMRSASSTTDRIQFAFRTLTSRRPNTDEMQLIGSIFARQLARYQLSPTASKLLLSVGESPPGVALPPAELAAWTTVVNMLLCLDEAITK